MMTWLAVPDFSPYRTPPTVVPLGRSNSTRQLSDAVSPPLLITYLVLYEPKSAWVRVAVSLAVACAMGFASTSGSRTAAERASALETVSLGMTLLALAGLGEVRALSTVDGLDHFFNLSPRREPDHDGKPPIALGVP